jgi:putative membrane protein
LEEAVIYMKNQLSSAFLMSLLALSSVAVQAQDSSQHMDNGASKMMKSADAHFAMKAAQGGMAEVKMGQLTADKAGSPDVKAFGQQMVDDHTKANDQLKSIAKDEGMTLPGDVNQKQQAMYDRLSKLSGADFDKQYVKSMVMDHQEDVKDFQKEANSGKDEKIKSFASQTLPTLQQHLDKIKSIQSKMGSGSSM